jgi:uncharacterized membrane protein
MKSNEKSFLEQIASKAIEQGFVDPEMVADIEKYYDAHSVICSDKANLLLNVNSAVRSDPRNCSAWAKLFAQAICRFVVFDLQSPGEVEEEESQWLEQYLAKEEGLSEAEVRLLKEIQEDACRISPAIQRLIDQIPTPEPEESN